MADAELRSLPAVTAWLAAGFAARRVRPSPETDAAVAAALLACAAELPRLPPAGVVADLALLLAGAKPTADRPPFADDELRTAVRAYDDDVLARLVATPRFDDVLAAFAHLAPSLRGSAVALLLANLLERARFTGTAVSTGVLRRALARGRDAHDAEVGEALAAREGARLADEYLRLARGARQCRALVEARDVFAIDHLAVLGTFGRRLEAQQIAASAEAFTAALPRRLPTRLRRGTVASHLAEDDTYPAGGFSAITPGGASANIENLVPSELAYMEDSPDGVDLFTLRYIENELLFYTRDESVYRRQRHAITIVLDPALAHARVKDAALPYQRLVLALGAVVAAIRWLIDQLAEEALAVTLVFPPRVLVGEHELVGLLLAGEVESGVVTIVEVEPAIALEAARTSATPLRDAITIGGAAPPVTHSRELRRLDVTLPEAAAWEDWTGLVEDLLRWIV